MSWILLNIIININSLVTHGHCIFRSWNIAANDNHLWEKQYVALYGNRAKPKPAKLIEGKNDGLLLEPVDTRIITDWKESVQGLRFGSNCFSLKFRWMLFSFCYYVSLPCRGMLLVVLCLFSYFPNCAFIYLFPLWYFL